MSTFFFFNLSENDIIHLQIMSLIILKYLFSVNLYFFVANIFHQGAHTRHTVILMCIG